MGLYTCYASLFGMGKNFNPTPEQIPYINSFNATHKEGNTGLDALRQQGDGSFYGTPENIMAFADYSNSQIILKTTNSAQLDTVIIRADDQLAVQIAAAQSQVAADILNKANYSANSINSAYILPDVGTVMNKPDFIGGDGSIQRKTNILPILAVGVIDYMLMRKKR